MFWGCVQGIHKCCGVGCCWRELGSVDVGKVSVDNNRQGDLEKGVGRRGIGVEEVGGCIVVEC